MLSLQINQYMQLNSPSSKEVFAHIFALGDVVQFAGTQDAKFEYMAVLRQAAHIVEQIGILTESRSKLDAINSGKKVLKPYKVRRFPLSFLLSFFPLF